MGRTNVLVKEGSPKSRQIRDFACVSVPTWHELVLGSLSVSEGVVWRFEACGFLKGRRFLPQLRGSEFGGDPFQSKVDMGELGVAWHVESMGGGGVVFFFFFFFFNLFFFPAGYAIKGTPREHDPCWRQALQPTCVQRPIHCANTAGTCSRASCTSSYTMAECQKLSGSLQMFLKTGVPSWEWC